MNTLTTDYWPKQINMAIICKDKRTVVHDFLSVCLNFHLSFTLNFVSGFMAFITT